MMLKKFIGILTLSSFFYFFIGLPKVLAHCPLCTVGAAALGGGAMWLGVSPIVVGLFIGGFAIALGVWINKMIKKIKFKYQEQLVLLASFVLTIIPLIPILGTVMGLPIYIGGSYGSIFNRVYLIDIFLVGSIIGGILVLLAPKISAKITSLRKGKKIPYQGMTVTLVSMIIIGIILQILM